MGSSEAARRPTEQPLKVPPKRFRRPHPGGRQIYSPPRPRMESSEAARRSTEQPLKVPPKDRHDLRAVLVECPLHEVDRVNALDHVPVRKVALPGRRV